MRSSAKRLTGLTLAGLIAGAANASPAVSEALGYQVVYRGLFSLGRELPIADIRLDSETAAMQEEPLETTMVASSAAYAQVESVYPIRYRFRSWTDAATGHVVGLEAYEKTHREKHRLYLRDVSTSDMRRVDPADREELTDLLAGDMAPMANAQPLFDRLGLLTEIRRQTLAEGTAFDVPVTNGRDRMRYRVHVQTAVGLELDGVELPSWKLRLDATEVDERGLEVAAHRPVYIWLSRDARRIPLRVDVRHAVGLFRVQLNTPAAQQTALLAVNP